MRRIRLEEKQPITVKYLVHPKVLDDLGALFGDKINDTYMAYEFFIHDSHQDKGEED